jgi:hypothetical protein
MVFPSFYVRSSFGLRDQGTNLLQSLTLDGLMIDDLLAMTSDAHGSCGEDLGVGSETVPKCAQANEDPQCMTRP